MTVGLGDVDASADGCGHRFFNEVDLPGASLDARVDDGALLDSVMPEGTQMMTRGLKKDTPATLWINSRSIRSVMS